MELEIDELGLKNKDNIGNEDGIKDVDNFKNEDDPSSKLYRPYLEDNTWSQFIELCYERQILLLNKIKD